MANVFYNMLSEIMAEGYIVTLLQDDSNLKFKFSIKIAKLVAKDEFMETCFESNSLREGIKLIWESVFGTEEKQINNFEEDGMHYSKIFQNKVGDRLKARYETGDPPRLHRLLFDTLVRELHGQDKGIVVLSPIISELRTSQAAVAQILSCLEAYGYLRITRIPNRIDGGTNLEFEILRKIY